MQLTALLMQAVAGEPREAQCAGKRTEAEQAADQRQSWKQPPVRSQQQARNQLRNSHQLKAWARRNALNHHLTEWSQTFHLHSTMHLHDMCRDRVSYGSGRIGRDDRRTAGFTAVRRCTQTTPVMVDASASEWHTELQPVRTAGKWAAHVVNAAECSIKNLTV